MPTIGAEFLALLFTEARTHRAWRPDAVSDDTLRELYGLARMPPTAMNAQPARFVFARGAEAKERLRPALAPGNVEKAMTAPVTAIVACDTRFAEKLSIVAPHMPQLGAQVAEMPLEARQRMALMSATLEAAYLVMAARSLGLDCGPMSGFDPERVDAAFFPDGAWRSFLLVNLGHGDPAALKARQPRLEFDDACRIL
jgi:3-hydroxypropanoate dehydrogenase